MGVYQLGALQSWQQAHVLNYIATTFTVAATLSSEGRLETITRDLTGPEQTSVTNEVATITSQPDPAIAQNAEKVARKATVKGNYNNATIASLNAAQIEVLIEQYTLYKMAEDGWIQAGVIIIP